MATTASNMSTPRDVSAAQIAVDQVLKEKQRFEGGRKKNNQIPTKFNFNATQHSVPFKEGEVHVVV
jgi:hypothetical protein